MVPPAAGVGATESEPGPSVQERPKRARPKRVQRDSEFEWSDGEEGAEGGSSGADMWVLAAWAAATVLVPPGHLRCGISQMMLEGIAAV